MPARIFCKYGPLRGVSAEIGDEATIGRSRNVTVRLQAELISGEHARIRFDPEAASYVLEDLGSTNGTALDGVRLRGAERLGHLHVITLAGEHDFFFQDLEACADRRGHPEPGPEPGPRRYAEDTAVDDQPPVLPAMPAFEAPGIAPRERTVIDDQPPVLPAHLAGAEHEDTEPSVPRPEIPDGTQIQEIPALLPGVLAGKAEETEDGEKPTVKLDPAAVAAAAAPGGGDTVTEEKLEELLLEEPDTAEVDALDDQAAGNASDSQAFALAVARPEGDIRYLPLRDGENPVGRSEDSAVHIVSPDISRRHALITVSGGEVTVRDVGSSNHTFVEGVRLERDVPAQIQHGSRLKFGGVRVRLMHWVGGRGDPDDERSTKDER